MHEFFAWPTGLAIATGVTSALIAGLILMAIDHVWHHRKPSDRKDA